MKNNVEKQLIEKAIKCFMQINSLGKEILSSRKKEKIRRLKRSLSRYQRQFDEVTAALAANPKLSDYFECWDYEIIGSINVIKNDFEKALEGGDMNAFADRIARSADPIFETVYKKIKSLDLTMYFELTATDKEWRILIRANSISIYLISDLIHGTMWKAIEQGFLKTSRKFSGYNLPVFYEDIDNIKESEIEKMKNNLLNIINGTDEDRINELLDGLKNKRMEEDFDDDEDEF